MNELDLTVHVRRTWWLRLDTPSPTGPSLDTPWTDRPPYALEAEPLARSSTPALVTTHVLRRTPLYSRPSHSRGALNTRRSAAFPAPRLAYSARRPDPRALSRLCAERRELLSCAAKGLQLELLNRQAAVSSRTAGGVGISSRKRIVVLLLVIGAHLASPAERRLRRGACACLLAQASLIARLSLHSRS